MRAAHACGLVRWMLGALREQCMCWVLVSATCDDTLIWNRPFRESKQCIEGSEEVLRGQNLCSADYSPCCADQSM